MIVHTFGPAWGSADLSPFVIKLQTWLRMAGVPYTTQVSDLRKMPGQKLPAITLDDGRRVGDSQHIIEHLTEVHSDPLGEALRTPAEQAASRALRALFESELYFAYLYLRWMRDDSFALLEPVMSDYLAQLGIPRWLRPMAVRGSRRQMLAQLRAQGTGRRSYEDVCGLAISGQEAVAELLGDRPWLLGDRPSAIDATAFGFLHALLSTPVESPAKRHAQQQTRLLAYEQRIRAHYWPELPQRLSSN